MRKASLVLLAGAGQAVLCAVGVAVAGALAAEGGRARPRFPVAPEVFIDRFRASEGITFNAQSLAPIVGDDRIWAFKLADGTSPAGPPEVAARTGEGGLDGLVADEFGAIYVADNGAGKIRKFDPKTGEMLLVAEGMPGVASLVFGEGTFDREAIYATSTRRGGGKIWKVRVGVRGAPVHR